MVIVFEMLQAWPSRVAHGPVLGSPEKRFPRHSASVTVVPSPKYREGLRHPCSQRNHKSRQTQRGGYTMVGVNRSTRGGASCPRPRSTAFSAHPVIILFYVESLVSEDSYNRSGSFRWPLDTRLTGDIVTFFYRQPTQQRLLPANQKNIK